LASQPWITPDDLTGDIARLIGIVTTPYVDDSNPMLHSDELHAECRAKLAMILHAGHLNKCPTRAKAFGFIKTALQNHLRSLIQKYVFTEKRTGIKSSPKHSKFSERWFDPQPTKALCISLNDQEHHMEVGGLDSAFDKMEFLEELDQALTPDERDILQRLIQGQGGAMGYDNSVISQKRLKPLVASIRSKARTILRQNKSVDEIVAPTSVC